jgi:hypothetical protein
MIEMEHKEAQQNRHDLDVLLWGNTVVGGA